MTFYSLLHPKINYSVSYKAAHSFQLFGHEQLQTNGIKRHLACSAQSTSLSLKAVKSFRMNFSWKFSVLSVFLKWFLPLLLELNGPTTQHNLNDGTLLQHSQLMFLFYCWCACVRQKTQHKNVFFLFIRGPMAIFHLFRSIQTPTSLFKLFRLVTQYETRSDFCTIYTSTAQTCDEWKVL